MDPLSALSLASTIIQLVDFGSKLLSKSVQLYKATNGTLKAHEEDAFEKLCDEAAAVAEEFLSRLKELKVRDGKHRGWEFFKAAVRAAWSQDEIYSLQKRLSTLKESLNSRVILSIAQNLKAETLRLSIRFDSLDGQTQKVLVAIVESQDDLSHRIVDSVAKMLRRLEVVNRDERHNTRQAIVDLRNAVLSRQDPVNVITAQVEMLDVCQDEEKDLRSSIGRKILESLSYPCMTDRYEDILQAHPKIFDWIYSDTKTWQLPWSDFRKWLADDGGLYWIHGKVGSGKSTLMKYIVDDDRTRGDLRTWSQNTPT
ncbi:hypothetical protein BDZ45DRAFT_808104 [Acephala macrosclerotiorum]|nr:hypothetical protein BDZ45DRAFT_808104 [Acephala macrosclerotiorum]